ncbi:MAG: hypothetical protein KBT34_10490 [Prevotella sp.]|nr:hypothetical protein [Candidatus Prevotella equi]
MKNIRDMMTQAEVCEGCRYGRYIHSRTNAKYDRIKCSEWHTTFNPHAESDGCTLWGR